MANEVFILIAEAMWLDVVLFATGAFAGSPTYLGIMQGTAISRLIIAVFALPFLYGYLIWQSRLKGLPIENRPVLAIIKLVTEIRMELTLAQQEIERRKAAEKERDQLINELQNALAEVKTLRGFLPICSHCKSIRDDTGYWNRLEAYIERYSDAEFTHSICPDCVKVLYPDLDLAHKGQ